MKAITACALAVAVVAVSVVAVLVGRRVALPSGPDLFAGEFVHDLGDHIMSSEHLDLEHVFRLRNVSGRTLRVEKVTTTCGCVSSEVSIREILPGREVEVPVTLQLLAPGRRQESIAMLLGDDGAQRLVLSATGRRAHSFDVVQEGVKLSAGGVARILLVATDLESDAEPGEPTLDAHPDISADFGGWQLVFPHDSPSRRPARWHGVLTVQHAGDFISPEARRVTIRFEDGFARRVDILGRPWNVRQPQWEVSSNTSHVRDESQHAADR